MGLLEFHSTYKKILFGIHLNTLVFAFSRCEYGPWVYFIFFIPYGRDQEARLFVTDTPFQTRVMKHSSLFGPFIGYKENKVL